MTASDERNAMSHHTEHHRDDLGAAWPRWWRAGVIAAATLVMCSCQSNHLAKHTPHAAQIGSDSRVAGSGDACGPEGCPSHATESQRPTVHQTAATKASAACDATGCPAGAGCPSDGSCAVCSAHPDEYLCDGGDRHIGAALLASGEIAGLDQEDTVAHYVTVDGRQVLKPSSKVCIYAPRFAAVRKVWTPFAGEQVLQPIGVGQPLHVAGAVEANGAVGSTQNVELGRHHGSNKSQGYDTVLTDGALSTVIGPEGFDNALLPYEDLTVIRTGHLDHTESARLLEAATAAVAWTHEQAVQVVIDEQAATEAVKDEQVEVTFTVDPIGREKIRVIKVASTDAALPGDIVDFTIRVDNLGRKPVGNVTLVDNLTTRLEYVEGSAQSSLEAKFSTEENDGGSLVLRWDFGEPIGPGDGGLVRFECRVR